MLVHFPIVFWTVATGAYVAAIVTKGDMAFVIAKSANGAGAIMAVVAMIVGLLELRTIESESRAMTVATWHMMVMASAWLLFLVALLAPALPDLDPSSARFAAAGCAGVGFLLMACGGWLGGRLVYEFGIAVRRAAQ